MNLKQVLDKQPTSAFLAMAAFFLPIIPIWFLIGPYGAMGGLLYLAALMLVGDVTIKWVPLNKRLKGSSQITIMNDEPKRAVNDTPEIVAGEP